MCIQKHVHKHLLKIWKNKHQNANNNFFKVTSLLEFLLYFYLFYIFRVSKIFVYSGHILVS